jgi:hypothetical protein
LALIVRGADTGLCPASHLTGRARRSRLTPLSAIRFIGTWLAEHKPATSMPVEVVHIRCMRVRVL